MSLLGQSHCPVVLVQLVKSIWTSYSLFDCCFLCPSPGVLAHCCLHRDRKRENGAERRTMRCCESPRRCSWGYQNSWGQPKTLDHQPCKVYYSLTPACLGSQAQQLPIEHTSPTWLQLLQSLLGTCIMTMTPDPKVQLNGVVLWVGVLQRSQW